MKKFLSAAVFTVMAAAGAFAGAGSVSTHNMNPYSLGVEYQGAIQGHPMLYSFDSSAIVSHFARLHYSPCKFVRFSGGIGGAAPQNNTHDFLGNSYKYESRMGLSAIGSVALVLPKLIPVLSVTAGYEGSYLRYTEEETRLPVFRFGIDDPLTSPDSVRIFGKTSGKTHTPYIGLIFHPNRFVDFEIGGMYKIFDMKKNRNYNFWGWEYMFDTDENGVMTKTDSTWAYQRTNVRNSTEAQFNDIKKIEEARIYGSMTISEPRSGVYLNIGASAAPSVDKEYKTNSWLTRSSVWVSAGAMIRDPRYGKKSKGEFSNSYIELKQRQNEMALELMRDIDRELEQQAEEEDGE